MHSHQLTSHYFKLGSFVLETPQTAIRGSEIWFNSPRFFEANFVASINLGETVYTPLIEGKR